MEIIQNKVKDTSNKMFNPHPYCRPDSPSAGSKSKSKSSSKQVTSDTLRAAEKLFEKAEAHAIKAINAARDAWENLREAAKAVTAAGGTRKKLPDIHHF